MDRQGSFTEIARTGKVHGLDGTIRLIPSEKAEPLLETGSLLYLENRRGERIPVRIVEIRLEEKRNSRLFFVKFDRISNRSEAERFQDCPVYAEGMSERTTEPSDKPVIGFEVVDETGRVGVVEEVMHHPAQSLLRVARTGTSADELLIPWVDEYVVSIDREKEQLTCRNLTPLKDL